MKTYRRLYPDLLSFENLYRAARRAAAGKRRQPEVYAFMADLETNLFRLQRELDTRTWKPGPYRQFYVYEPKKRLVSAAPFRDRLVHHALHQVLEPLWEPRFIYDSYACRPGKGTHKAADRYTRFARQGAMP